MKKTVFAMAIAILFLMGCSGKVRQKEVAGSKDTVQVDTTTLEVKANDSISAEMEKAKSEIQESSDKLDKALDNL
jgi:PBP1b-binding outer membrane lipoprotein LpoB